MSADGARGGFEGSYLGDIDRISPQAVLECKICWTPYDPAEGDETRAIPPGTAFRDLPADWKCPECDAPKTQFMVVDDPGRAAMAEAEALKAAVAKLESAFREIHSATMRDTPFLNHALDVQAVGFAAWEGHRVGVLITPWFMNLILLPGSGEDWSGLTPGEKEVVAFPSGAYEFLHNVRPEIGGYKACSLFSPMAEFKSREEAAAVAAAVLPALLDPANRAETDRSSEIRAAREAELAAEAAPSEPTRRAMLGAGAREGGDA